MDAFIWSIPATSETAFVLGTFVVTPLTVHLVVWAIATLTDFFD